MSKEIIAHKNCDKITYEPIQLSHIVELIKDMKILYGRQFSNQWGEINDVIIAERFYQLLKELSVEQFQHGIQCMESNARVPTMPEFKKWCTDYKPKNFKWFTVSEAWALCMNYENDKNSTITVQALEALTLVKPILNIEGQKAAYFPFKGFYERIIERDTRRGIQQSKYINQKKLNSPKRDTRVTDAWTLEMRQELRKNVAFIFKALNIKPKVKSSSNNESN